MLSTWKEWETVCRYGCKAFIWIYHVILHRVRKITRLATFGRVRWRDSSIRLVSVFGIFIRTHCWRKCSRILDSRKNSRQVIRNSKEAAATVLLQEQKIRPLFSFDTSSTEVLDSDIPTSNPSQPDSDLDLRIALRKGQGSCCCPTSYAEFRFSMTIYLLPLSFCYPIVTLTHTYTCFWGINTP